MDTNDSGQMLYYATMLKHGVRSKIGCINTTIHRLSEKLKNNKLCLLFTIILFTLFHQIRNNSPLIMVGKK